MSFIQNYCLVISWGAEYDTSRLLFLRLPGVQISLAPISLHGVIFLLQLWLFRTPRVYDAHDTIHLETQADVLEGLYIYQASGRWREIGLAIGTAINVKPAH